MQQNAELLLTKRRNDIESQLDLLLPLGEDRDRHEIISAMRYSLLGGGKRIRGILALEVCNALCGDANLAMPAACALEMVHAYSLIHDDLPCMDDDDLRRGKPTCHKQFTEAVAVLAGDGLLTLAFETLSSTKTVELVGVQKAFGCIATLSANSGREGMLGGQAIDVTFEGKPLTTEQHSKMVDLKTGALIKAAVLCGCISAGATEQQTTLALEFGCKLGLAFQMTDDLLDVTSDAKTLGKNVLSDEKHHKNTFVSLYGMEETQASSQRLHREALAILQKLCPESETLPRLTAMLAGRNF